MAIVGLDLYYENRSFMAVMRQIPYGHYRDRPPSWGQILYGRDEDGSPWPCQDRPYRGDKSPITTVGMDPQHWDRSFMAVMKMGHHGRVRTDPKVGADPLWPL